jgi:uncharacterized protein DUF1549/uncharacterized protein DUF1553/cytochrome c
MLSAVRLAAVCCLAGGFGSSLLAAGAPTPEQLEFFEKQVRPLLIEHCSECHGAKKSEAGLRLDTKRGFIKGSDTGPIVVAGNVDGSLFMKALSYRDDETQMPPKGKLPDEKIAIFKKWLELGSPWPDEATGAADGSSAKNHWAFRPVKRPAIPKLRNAYFGLRNGSEENAINDVRSSSLPPPHSAISNPIDSFIVAVLQSKGLDLSPPADRYTFIRRVTLDLWGIPPTFEQVREFEEDSSPDAHERLIDRLLGSPLYGQRWARHWLDVARYADTKGYVFTAEPRYPYSYTYRDYVVDAFNADKPFDQFVLEQLAADQMGLEANSEGLAGMGFLTVGRRFLNNNNDIIDDRIDVVSRGLMGLTVGCARCHDHKFDPVPTADYYSLYGVFASSMEPEDLPIIGAPKGAAAYEVFQKELAKRERAVSDFEQQSLAKLHDELRERVGDCLQQVARQSNNWLNLPPGLAEKIQPVFAGKNEPRQQIVKRWEEFLKRPAVMPHPVLGPWHSLTKASAADFPKEVEKLVESWSNAEAASTKSVNSRVRQLIAEKKPATLIELAKLYGSLFDAVRGEWDSLKKATPDAKALPDEAAEQVRLILYGDGSPAMVSLDESRRLLGRDVRDKVTKLKREVENLKVTSPGAPPRAMVMRDGGIQNPRVLIRGNPGRPGNQVPRQFLEVVAGPERKPFTNGSGRLELAQAIVDPKNPLTPRVLVNRVWQHHFDTGLVPTPSDFGTRGLPPSHPELLDWLASEVIGIWDWGSRIAESNPDVASSTPHSALRTPQWSIKRLHRLMLTSAVYRQSSADNTVASSIDSEDRLLWKMPRQRLDFEAMRDSLLAVSGQLDTSMGGRPFENQMDVKSNRRTIYGLVNRNDLPGVFRAFDFADTEASAAERPQTTVPQQALFALNAPFVQEQARRLAAESAAAGADDQRLALLYHRVLAREPSSEERELSLRFLREALTTPTEKLTPWDRLAQVLLLTNEFLFVD